MLIWYCASALCRVFLRPDRYQYTGRLLFMCIDLEDVYVLAANRMFLGGRWCPETEIFFRCPLFSYERNFFDSKFVIIFCHFRWCPKELVALKQPPVWFTSVFIHLYYFKNKLKYASMKTVAATNCASSKQEKNTCQLKREKKTLYNFVNVS